MPRSPACRRCSCPHPRRGVAEAARDGARNDRADRIGQVALRHPLNFISELMEQARQEAGPLWWIPVPNGDLRLVASAGGPRDISRAPISACSCSFAQPRARFARARLNKEGETSWKVLKSPPPKPSSTTDA